MCAYESLGIPCSLLRGAVFGFPLCLLLRVLQLLRYGVTVEAYERGCTSRCCRVRVGRRNTISEIDDISGKGLKLYRRTAAS
eukprot:639211-Rhodomonas_salina.4